MANIKSQMKRNRQNEVRRERNKAVRSELKSRTKAALAAAESGADDAETRLSAAFKRIDTAAATAALERVLSSERTALLRSWRTSF